MSLSNIYQLHRKQEILWLERDNIENQIDNIRTKQDELNMQISIIESDAVQEVGYTKDEFDRSKDEIFSQLMNIEDDYNRLKNELNNINKELKSIYDSLSEKISQEIES